MKNEKIVTDAEVQAMLDATVSYRNQVVKKYSYLGEVERSDLEGVLRNAIFIAIKTYDPNKAVEEGKKKATLKTYVIRVMEWEVNDYLCNFCHGGIAMSHDDYSMRQRIAKAQESFPYLDEKGIAEILGISVKVLRTHMVNVNPVYTHKPIKGYEEDLIVEDTIADDSNELEYEFYRYLPELEGILHKVLTPKEFQWLAESKGLFGVKKRTLEDIGSEYGCKHQYVSRVNEASLEKLKEYFSKEASLFAFWLQSSNLYLCNSRGVRI